MFDIRVVYFDSKDTIEWMLRIRRVTKWDAATRISAGIQLQPRVIPSFHSQQLDTREKANNNGHRCPYSIYRLQAFSSPCLHPSMFLISS
jgi:hypothetical protein